MKLSGEYYTRLKAICLAGISEYRNKSINAYVDGEYKGIYWNAIYLAYFFYRYRFPYDDFFLIQMLQIDSRYYYEHEDFMVVVEKLRNADCSERIESNIKQGNLHSSTLEFHYDYCVKNKLDCVVDDAEKYILNSGDDFIGKKSAMNYLIEINGGSWFVENLYSKINTDTRREADRILYCKSPALLIPIMRHTLSESCVIDEKMYAANYLIKSNQIDGLQYYYEWVKENNTSYGTGNYYESINSVIGEFANEQGIEILTELCALTLADTFEDDDFDNLYRGAKEALNNIAAISDEFAEKVIRHIRTVIERDKHISNIGFLNYIELDINNRKTNLHKTKYTIETVKKLLTELN